MERSSPSPPRDNPPAREDQAWKSRSHDRAGDRDQLASDFTAHVGRGVNIEISQSSLNSRDQRRLGSRNSPTLEGDESRIVNQRLREIEDLRTVGSRGHAQREPGKRRYRGGDSNVGASWRATMDVCRHSVRGQSAKRYATFRLGGRNIGARRMLFRSNSHGCPRACLF